MLRFKMVGRDPGSIPTQYRTWVVLGAPDFTGAQYTGLKSGPAPMVDITAYAINDDMVIADFNLPTPSMWNPSPPEIAQDFPILKILPSQLDDAHLAIISDGYSSVDGYGHPDGYSDGYVYMFGGKLTNKIYRATLNNPADWSDTGATLPGNLYGASLAIANGSIWLFGGNDGYHNPASTIFSAPVSNPLKWTNNGNLLPISLSYSSLGMGSGFIYLFGGRGAGGATNVILRAPISNPLSWTNTGSTLPTPVYGSSIAQINGNWMKFGGMLNHTTPSNSIWQAPIGSPTSWTLSGSMPYANAHGQFVCVGNDGYLIGPMVGTGNGFTGIIQCHLNKPNQWFNTNQVVRGVISHSQAAIIADRVWLFGGSGERAIFACNQELKYNIYDPVVQAYGYITQTLLFNTDNVNYPFSALSMPYWKTDYLL
jgi:hypothetical protein